MAYKERDTLFIFLDESGNLDFSSTGTAYWSLTAVCTFTPTNGRHEFSDFLYQLADEGRGQECFHATVDRQEVRDEVFKIINKLPEDIEVHSVIANKCMAHPSLYRKGVKKGKKFVFEKDESKFYDLICRVLLQYIFQRWKFKKAKRIVVVLSFIFNKSKHDAIKGSLKTQLKAHTGAPFTIYFHQNKADMNCQIADYCGWAITIKWERGEKRSYDLIRPKIASEFEIFKHGYKKHY